MDEYRVNLEIYNGPLDLLLYLIRREEVDIYDIPIARITEQYIEYVRLLKQLDPNLAGEFLVLAATLMEIKTRMLLPTPPPEEGGEEGLEIDPRVELVRQLLEYKTFKDAAADLRTAHATRSRKFPRGKPPELARAPGEVDLEDVQVWDLLDAFSKVLTAIGADTDHEVIYDDTPIELHIADVMDRLRDEGEMTFAKVFEGRTNRTEIVGLFLALLELIRRRRIVAVQKRNFEEIRIALNPNPPEGGEDGRAETAGTYVAEPHPYGEPAGADAPERGHLGDRPRRTATGSAEQGGLDLKAPGRGARSVRQLEGDDHVDGGREDTPTGD